MITLTPGKLSVILTADLFTANVFARMTGATPTGSWGTTVAKTGSGFDVTVSPGLKAWNASAGIDPSSNLVISVIRTGSQPNGTFDITVSNSWGDVAHILGTVAASNVSYVPSPPYVAVPSFIRTFNIGGLTSGQLGQHKVEPSPRVVQRTDNPASLAIGDIVQVNLAPFSNALRLDANPTVHTDYIPMWRHGIRGKDLMFLVRAPTVYADNDFIGEYHSMFGVSDASTKVYLQSAVFNTGVGVPATIESLINNYGRAKLSNVGFVELAPGVDKGILVDYQVNMRDAAGLWGHYVLFKIVSAEDFTLSHMTISQNTNSPWYPRITHYITQDIDPTPVVGSLRRSVAYTINTNIFDYAFASDPLFNFGIGVTNEPSVAQPNFKATVVNDNFGIHQVKSIYRSLSGLLRESGMSYNVQGATNNARIQGLELEQFVNQAGGVLGLVIASADVIVNPNYTLEFSYDNITWNVDQLVNNVNPSFVIRTMRLAPYYRLLNDANISPVFAPEREGLFAATYHGPWTPDSTKLQAIFPAGISGWAPGSVPAQFKVIGTDLALADFWMGQDVLVPNVDLLKQPILYQFPNPSLTQIYAIVKYQQAGRQTIVGAQLLNGPPDLGPWEVQGVVYPANVVTITGPASAETGKVIDLIGAVALAPGRSIQSVYWNQVSGPSITSVNIIAGFVGSMVLTVQLPFVSATDQLTVQFNVVDDLGIVSSAQFTVKICQPYTDEAPCFAPAYTDETITPIVCP